MVPELEPDFYDEKSGRLVNQRIPPKLVVGLIHHVNLDRAQSQALEAKRLIAYLAEAGFEIQEQTSFHQAPLKPVGRLSVWDYLNVARTHLAQEVFTARESRRRKGLPTRLSMGKKHRIVKRTFALLRDPGALKRAVSRREIEAALSLKHLHLWTCLANSSAAGAIVVEDDFSIRGDTSLQLVGGMLDKYLGSADYIDLAGGFSRAELSLPDQRDGDLVLNYLLSNTTCGYFISRRAAIGLVDLINSENDLRYLGADFIIGSLNDAGFQGVTVLPESLPFVRGSLEGVVESSIPY